MKEKVEVWVCKDFRMKKIAILFLVAIACCTSEEPASVPVVNSFSELIEVLGTKPEEKRQDIVDLYFKEDKNFPVIENETIAYFVYQSKTATSVNVAGDFNGWSQNSLTNIAGTDLWYLAKTFEINARLDYKFVVDGSWILDPKNPNTMSGGFGANSELAMPAYVQPSEILTREGVTYGELVTGSIASTNTGKTYGLKILLPPVYDPLASYPVVYFQDGSEYLSLAKASTTIGNLIADGNIESLIAVFVTPTNRNVEYAFADRFKYTDFFVNELVPYIDNSYATDPSARRRAVIGDSYGGNISAIISFKHPEVFGNCGLHSGAFQENGFDTNTIVMDGVKKEIRVASVWGSYEFGLAYNMIDVRDYLMEKEYDIYWKELPEGHSWGLWRATIDDMLIFFFPLE